MLDQKNRFVIEDCQSKPTFSSFLPGVAGPLGVPVWCYYTNRGQAVTSFGVQDKDHAIMEFTAANVGARDAARTGFRTFVRVHRDGRTLSGELFEKDTTMHIGMGELELTTKAEGLGLEADLVYFGVPNERNAALARVITITNGAGEALELEVLDGLAEMIAYGVNHDTMKNMTNLAMAWMQAEDYEEGLAYFRTRASMADSAKVTEVLGGNFGLAWDETGKRIAPVIQSRLVFGQDVSLARPEGFLERGVEIAAGGQIPFNQFPCCFMPKKALLQPGESVTLYSLYGQTESKERLAEMAGRISGKEWFEKKREEALKLIEDLCARIETHTADPVFDAHCKQIYLDNLLRGGVPTFFRHGETVKPFYLYSRKHGDPEREYNYFSLGQEYYAQGNGNFRDVNQNRRCDVLFSPELGAENIHTFYDLIQTDGYNPLVVTPSTYTLPEEKRAKYPEPSELLSGAFTPGRLAMALEDQGFTKQEAVARTAEIVCESQSEANADFGEGYWIDHWTYNLDLIEAYLSVFPEDKSALLFGDRRYRYYEGRAAVNPRAKRYVVTEGGLRQYHALTEKKDVACKWARAADGGELRSTLMEKLILLCAIKAGTLDAAGMGVEMEAGKPGWYDALNGLPGLLGSSTAETCEVSRMLDFVIQALSERGGELELYREIAELAESTARIFRETEDLFCRWERLNELREDYRAATLSGYEGQRVSVSAEKLADWLEAMAKAVRAGIEKAEKMGGGILPTYFTFSAPEIQETPEGPMPKKLVPHMLPPFLEGPVRWMKLERPLGEKKALADLVQGSGLYDEKLHMYKVNTSLKNESYEVGRAKAFTPGWLENESVWLHMEYKYLLELLRSGLYDEFAAAFRGAAVPFLDPAVYGRSPLENVSFIASSANPDPALHGRGFVARLSGSTVEFLNMWQLMFFGERPFQEQNGRLSLELAPFVPDYLLGNRGRVKAAFLGTVLVTYQAEGLPCLKPGSTRARSYLLTLRDGSEARFDGPVLGDEPARMVRDGKVADITVAMGPVTD